MASQYAINKLMQVSKQSKNLMLIVKGKNVLREQCCSSDQETILLCSCNSLKTALALAGIFVFIIEHAYHMFF